MEVACLPSSWEVCGGRSLRCPEVPNQGHREREKQTVDESVGPDTVLPTGDIAISDSQQNVILLALLGLLSFLFLQHAKGRPTSAIFVCPKSCLTVPTVDR